MRATCNKAKTLGTLSKYLRKVTHYNTETRGFVKENYTFKLFMCGIWRKWHRIPYFCSQKAGCVIL